MSEVPKLVEELLFATFSGVNPKLSCFKSKAD